MTDTHISAAGTAFLYSWKENGSPDALRGKFAAGVSLHGHTWHSFESLAFLPNAIQKTYILPPILRWAEKQYTRKWKGTFDYSRGYWTSPVSPDAAYGLEAKQIADLGLSPLVSFTDHDAITVAGDESVRGKVPVSVEWTVPYHGAVFHIGVHNIPAAQGDAVMDMLRRYTENPDPSRLANILAHLDEMPETLIVFNHPLSDQGRIGFEIHGSRVEEFLQSHRKWLHALEVNAMQPWHMNRRVAAMAERAELPVVAGGDRHSFEPNGAINLISAKSFAEFARELREEKKSTVLFMPQCERSLALRYAENVKMIMEEYPDLPGRRYWHDRVFYRFPDGVTRSLTEMIGPRSYAFDALQLAVDALGLTALAFRPLTPVFTETKKRIEV